jgi:energy-coupling factor transporter transmembrane protein EcfT
MLFTACKHINIFVIFIILLCFVILFVHRIYLIIVIVIVTSVIYVKNGPFKNRSYMSPEGLSFSNIFKYL